MRSDCDGHLIVYAELNESFTTLISFAKSMFAENIMYLVIISYLGVEVSNTIKVFLCGMLEMTLSSLQLTCILEQYVVWKVWS